MKIDLIREFMKFPPTIMYKNFFFSLELFHHGDEVRLCYSLNDEDKDFNNPFINEGEDYFCTFLFLREGILNEKDLIIALKQLKKFLIKKNLIDLKDLKKLIKIKL